ncbi:hypothetical protein FTX61_17620 [Nitriliruptoraceae bacterium ZYF776]|nr:hypothetical protein [Profundirhabdus halotolerans]
MRHLATALLATSALLLAGCGDDPGATDDVDLDAGPVSPVPDDTDGDAAPGADDTTDDPSDDDAGAAADGGDQVAEADVSVAGPGRWVLGDAGHVTFDVQDGALVLVEAVGADGWDVSVDEEAADEIEVDLRRGSDRWWFEAELDGDGELELEIDQELEDAEPGTFELLAAGQLTVEVTDGQLRLVDLALADGWEVTSRSEDDDEIELDLAAGDARFEIEVELEDGGLVDVSLEYTVTGRV